MGGNLFTKTQIVNLALTRLGTERIADITDNNKRAKLMSDIYDMLRRKLIRHARWNFALKRAQLAKLASTPAFGFEFEYQLPADYIEIWDVGDSSGVFRNLHPGCEGFLRLGQDYVIEDGKLLTDEGSIFVLYSYDNTDTSKYTDTFIESFALSLAHKACYSITQDTNLTNVIFGELEKYLGEARHDTSREYTQGETYVVEAFTGIRG